MSKKTGLLINVNDNKVEVVEVKGLKDYYRLIGCKLVDIVNLDINGKRYDIVVDDEGILIENPKISAVDDNGKPMLVGNIIVLGKVDDEGDSTSLTVADIEHIKNSICTIKTNRHPDGYNMLCHVSY